MSSDLDWTLVRPPHLVDGSATGRVRAGTDLQAFVVAAAEAVTTDYIPGGAHKASVLAATKLLGPKERDTATFTAPTAPGRYEFICSFPGHFQVGMRGVLIVQ